MHILGNTVYGLIRKILEFYELWCNLVIGSDVFLVTRSKFQAWQNTRYNYFSLSCLSFKFHHYNDLDCICYVWFVRLLFGPSNSCNLTTHLCSASALHRVVVERCWIWANISIALLLRVALR